MENRDDYDDRRNLRSWQPPRPKKSHVERTCPSCGGNDGDMPCAYPGQREQQPGCLRAEHMQPNGEVRGASRLAGEASASTVVLDLNRK